MRVGIISDTHNLLRAEVFERFAGVEHILHAGDVGSPDILDALAAIAPVTAVWGNTDDRAIRERVPEIARVSLGGASVVVMHGQQLGSPSPKRMADAFPEADLVVFGHTHQPVIERVGTTLAVNPGSAGRQRFSDPVSVAIAEIEAGGAVRAQLLRLDASNR